MGVLSVVVWACLMVVVMSATADDIRHPQPLPLSLLLSQGRTQPHYITQEAHDLGFLHNNIQQQQDLGVSEVLNEEEIEVGVQRPLRFPASHEKPPSDPQVHVSSEAAILTHYTPSGLLEEPETSKRTLQNPKQKTMYGIPPRRKDSKTHTRQKRYTLKYKLRSIAVPLSVFNFLGFLPVRVPGLPYHNDLPTPDHRRYNTKYDVYVPRYRRRKTFRRL